MNFILNVLIVASFSFVSISEEIASDRFFKGSDEDFLQFLRKLHKQIDVDIPGKKAEQLKIHSDIISILKKIRASDSCFGFSIELKGSSIENVKIGFPDEFDFGLVNRNWNGKIVLLENEKTPAGFGYAKQQQETCLKNYLVKDEKDESYIDPAEVRQRLLQLVRLAMVDLKMDGQIKKLDEKGPAVTYEKITNNDKAYPEISIDLAIAINLLEWPVHARRFSRSIMSAHAQLVPKQMKEPYQNVWQISFSQVEKKIMQDIDRDGGCRKKVLQLAKHFLARSISRGFCLASYHLKMTLFHLNREIINPNAWKQNKLAHRFKDFINKLLYYLEKKKSLPSFFIPSYDIFEGKPDLPSAATCIHQTIQKLHDDPTSFLPENERPQPREKTYHRKSKKRYYVINI